LSITAVDREAVLREARAVLEAYQAEISKSLNEQSPKLFEQIKKRLDSVWDALGYLHSDDKEARALKERLYPVSIDTVGRIGELRKVEAEEKRARLAKLAEEERARLAKLATERQQERSRRGEGARWNEPIGFRDIPFGMSLVAVQALQTQLHCEKTSCSGQSQVGAVGVSILMDFLNDALDAVTLSFDSQSFPTMKATFLERYGSPTHRKSTPVQNRFGAQHENEELEWSGSEVYIVLSRYGSRLDTSSASIRTQQGRAMELEKLRQQILKGKKDL
jgi:hypothetical protein